MTIRETLRSSWPLRAFLVALIVRLVGSLLGPGLRSLPVVGLLDGAANLVLFATLGYFLFILLVRLQRRLLHQRQGCASAGRGEKAARRGGAHRPGYSVVAAAS